MWWFGVDEHAGKQAEYDEPISVNADQQTLRRAAVDDHPHERGTDDDGAAHDDSHDRGTDDRGTSDDAAGVDDSHDRGTDDDGPVNDDLNRGIDLDNDRGDNTIERLDIIDTLGLDRCRNRSRCRPDRCPRPATACTVSPSSCGDMEK